MGTCLSRSSKSDSPAASPTPAYTTPPGKGDSATLSHMLCDACNHGLFKHDNFRQAIDHWGGEASDDAKHEYIYTTTWGTILASVARDGCRWCKLLVSTRDSLPDATFPRGSPNETVNIRVYIKTSTPVDWTDVQNWLEIHINNTKAAVYYIYADHDGTVSKEIGLGAYCINSPSYVDYDEAKKCLENCSREHHTSCPSATDTTLPTRLIDCSEPLSPRLYETHRKMKGRYATLSYVWGGDQKQKTIKANLSAYVHGGLPKELPKTIADAVVATNKLGLRWLWVDALCIIQDSEEDKLRELADMAHIYQDSYVTLSVLSSFRYNHGFLPDEDEQPVLPFICADGTTGTMKLRYFIQRPGRGRSYRYQTVTMHNPLDTRAWCFQETTLSPRRLVFQPPRVSYACRGYDQDITRPEEGGERGPPVEMPYGVLFSYQKKGLSSANDEELRDLWDGLITTYSSCKISLQSDKLVAFASIAEVYQSITKDEYLAGLWKSELLDGLLWEPCMHGGERPKEYRAPTWSWTSIDTDDGVTMHRPHMNEMPSTEYEASIVSCVVVPRSEIHPLGEVKEATLVLQAKMHSLMNDGSKCRFIEEKPTVTVRPYETRIDGGGWVAPSGSCLVGDDGRLIQFDSREGTAQDEDMDFYVVALREGKTWGDQPQPGFMLGLLLLKVDGSFRRVARIDLPYYPDWLDEASPTIITIV
ncbi:HET-domain-containing protein [Agrocybe pediades]|nr:HET-domain-containing protein [Agrocybe pediades]